MALPLAKHFSETFLENIALKMKEITFSSDEVIVD
jgi:hypothetical protein